MKHLQSASSEKQEEQKCRFDRFRPLLSKLEKPAKTIGKIAAGAALLSLTAIAGANLGTYLDYAYDNYDYRKLENKTEIALKGVLNEAGPVKSALEAVRVKVVGAVPPEIADLYLKLENDGQKVLLSARYVMVWSTNKGIAHRDEEEVRISWLYSESEGRFLPLTAQTRYHNKWVEMPLAGLKDAPVIVIQNPAHTPGIPGASLRYIDDSPGAVDIFTVFSAEKWAGSCLSSGLPQKFSTMPVTFNTEILE